MLRVGGRMSRARVKCESCYALSVIWVENSVNITVKNYSYCAGTDLQSSFSINLSLNSGLSKIGNKCIYSINNQTKIAAKHYNIWYITVYYAISSSSGQI